MSDEDLTRAQVMQYVEAAEADPETKALTAALTPLEQAAAVLLATRAWHPDATGLIVISVADDGTLHVRSTLENVVGILGRVIVNQMARGELTAGTAGQKH